MRHEPEGHTALTKQRLVDAATAEFLKSGYEKTSLRTICARAELTTGALYFFFEGKDDLFSAVVSPVIEQTTVLLDEAQGSNLAEAIVNMYYDHEDAAKIVLANREHLQINVFFDEVADKLTEQTKQRLAAQAAKGAPVVSDYVIHWLSHLQMDTVLHVFSHELPREQAVDQLNVMMRFLSGGMTSLVA